MQQLQTEELPQIQDNDLKNKIYHMYRFTIFIPVPMVVNLHAGRSNAPQFLGILSLAFFSIPWRNCIFSPGTEYSICFKKCTWKEFSSILRRKFKAYSPVLYSKFFRKF